MINGSWQRRSNTENTESTERYCFLCALYGYKPFQEIIKSLLHIFILASIEYKLNDVSVWSPFPDPCPLTLTSTLKPQILLYFVSTSNYMVIGHSALNFETQITLITQIDSGCENQCNLCLH